MNRRQFLQYTVALSASVSFTQFVTAAPQVPYPTASPPPPWIPTQAEVDEWLEYYKLAVRSGVEKFSDIVLNVGPPDTDEQHLFQAAERAFYALERDRMSVAVSQGLGYAVGRDGLPRFADTYTGPSNASLGWYNGWALGNLDYRWHRGEAKLPRSPGITWPGGRRSSLGWYR